MIPLKILLILGLLFTNKTFIKIPNSVFFQEQLMMKKAKIVMVNNKQRVNMKDIKIVIGTYQISKLMRLMMIMKYMQYY